MGINPIRRPARAQPIYYLQIYLYEQIAPNHPYRNTEVLFDFVRVGDRAEKEAAATVIARARRGRAGQAATVMHNEVAEPVIARGLRAGRGPNRRARRM
jgi:hypothetical protein